MKSLTNLFLITLIPITLLNSCKKEKSEPDTDKVSASGYAFDDNLSNSVPAAPIISTGVLPDVVDLSPKMPPVGDQGSIGSCVSWAAAYYIKSYQEKIQNNYSYFNSNGINYENVMSPAYLYNKIIINPSDCNSGSWIPTALSLLQKEGVSNWELMPYSKTSCNQNASQNAITNASKNKIKSFYSINFTVQSGYDIAKQYLNAGIPIIIGCAIDNEFLVGKKGTNGEFIWSSNFNVFEKKPGHALTIVGYDDKLQAFKIVNSWGTNWGNNGYGYIKYDWLDDVVLEAFVVIDEKSSVTNKSVIRISGQNSGDVIIGKNHNFNVQINNDGNEDFTITDITLTNNSQGAYSFYNGKPTLPLNIKAGGNLDLGVRFAPSSVQQYIAEIVVTSNAFSGNGKYSLSYSGIPDNANTSIIRLETSNCPDVTIGQIGSFNLIVNNDGNSSFTVNNITSSDPAFSVQNFNSTNIGPNSNKLFTINFSPTQAKLHSTNITVQSDAKMGNNTITVYGSGESISNNKIAVQPNIGSYTACNNSNSTRDLTNYNSSLRTDYITNKFKLKVSSIDSSQGIITFVVKQCDNYNFKSYYTVQIYESNPVYFPTFHYSFPNDPDATINFLTKFSGHDKKTYVGIIYDGLAEKEYCTEDVTISW